MRPAGHTEADRLGPPRWRGQPGRLEVWYATASEENGTGYWIHHETVSPTNPALDAYGHGWIAVFPAEATPRLERFEKTPVNPDGDASWFRSGDVHVGPGVMRGSAGGIEWDLTFRDDTPPLFTFPQAAWEREFLPGAQVVPWPHARFAGTVSLDGQQHRMQGSGAVARIYGHANPQRWCWAHAQLDAGSVIEVVSAVARRPGLRRLPPVTMLRLRLAGEPDWPTGSLAVLWRLRSRVGTDGFSLAGSLGQRHISLKVHLPADQRVRVDYADPDGSTATCTNSERADLTLSVADNAGKVRHWELAGRAHAEMGTRP